MTTPYMVALAALNERQEEVQVFFVSPLGDQSAEVDVEAETAAFAARPDPVREIEAKSVISEKKSSSNQRSAFAEVAGLYL